MKFVELHLKESNRKIAVNPLSISVVTVTEEGTTRIFYNNINQRDNVKEEYEVVLMRIHDALMSWYHMQEPLLLRIYIQTVIDSKPFYLRTEKVEISDHGVYFIGFDCNQIYLYDFNDVVCITPDAAKEGD